MLPLGLRLFFSCAKLCDVKVLKRISQSLILVLGLCGGLWPSCSLQAQTTVNAPVSAPAQEATPAAEAEPNRPAPVAPPVPAVVKETADGPPAEFGPVVTAYLAYLDVEEGVVDDSSSRREVASAYLRHNSNRVRALRVMALRLARASGNDYLPEMVAVGARELVTLFDPPPLIKDLQLEEVYANTFRYLGRVNIGADVFYLFARLDPYEQEERLRP